MIYKTSLFDIPIYKITVPTQQQLKEKFINEIFPYVDNNPPNNEKLNLYSDYFDGIKKLDSSWIDLYKPTIEQFKLKAGFNKNQKWTTNIDAWFNVGVKGTQQEEHDHLGGYPSTLYSAIHYIIFDPNEHESTIFFNPIHQMYLRNMHMVHSEGNLPADWEQPWHFPKVNEGDMVFFPSYVKHAVPYQESEKRRATIALNLQIFGDSI